MSSNSTRKRHSRKAADRPKKPYPDFPLTPHASGAWQKKIRGNIHYFGKWARRENGKLVRIEGDGWKEALKEYKAVADDLHAGRTPRVQGDGLTVAGLCNAFLTAKLRKVDSGELGSRRLGHASIQLTLDTYSHVLPSIQERAAEKMNQILGRQPPGTQSGG
jgi:hypothetical protein